MSQLSETKAIVEAVRAAIKRAYGATTAIYHTPPAKTVAKPYAVVIVPQVQFEASASLEEQRHQIVIWMRFDRPSSGTSELDWRVDQFNTLEDELVRGTHFTDASQANGLANYGIPPGSVPIESVAWRKAEESESNDDYEEMEVVFNLTSFVDR